MAGFDDVLKGIQLFSGLAGGFAQSYEQRRQADEAQQLQLLTLLSRDPESQLVVAQSHEVLDPGVPTFRLGGQHVTVRPRALLGASGLFNLAGSGSGFDVSSDPLIGTFDSAVATRDNVAGLRKTIVERTESFAKTKNSLLAELRKSTALSPEQQSALVDKIRGVRSFAGLEELVSELSALEGVTRTQDRELLQGAGTPQAAPGLPGQAQVPQVPPAVPSGAGLAPQALPAPAIDPTATLGRLTPDEQARMVESLTRDYGYSREDAVRLAGELPARPVLVQGRALPAAAPALPLPPQAAPTKAQTPALPPQAPALPTTNPQAAVQLTPADSKRLTRLEAERDTAEGTLERLEAARSKLTSESARSEMGKRIDDTRSNITRLEGNIDTIRKRAEPSNDIVQTEQGAFLVDKRSGLARPLSADGKPLPPKAPTEGQARATNYGTRAQAANAILEQLEDAGFRGDTILPYLVEQGGGALGTAAGAAGAAILGIFTGGVGLGVAGAGASAGGGLGVALAAPLANALRSDDAKLYAQARLDFVASVLRKESGAAISATEDSREARRYFPVPGDSDAVLTQKRAARALVIQTLERESGRALPSTPRAVTRAGQAATKAGQAATKAGQGQSAPGTHPGATGAATSQSLSGEGLRRAAMARLAHVTPQQILDPAILPDQAVRSLATEPLGNLPAPQRKAFLARMKRLGIQGATAPRAVPAL